MHWCGEEEACPSGQGATCPYGLASPLMGGHTYLLFGLRPSSGSGDMDQEKPDLFLPDPGPNTKRFF